MNIPRTSKFTLKKIIENLDKINGFGHEPPKLNSEQKRKLMELSSMYESFGECLKNEEALLNTARGITELCELAETYALNECGEWFQQEIVKKDMKELKRRVQEFQNVMKEAYARMQQAGVAYQDIGHTLGRYFDLNPNMGGTGKYKETSGPRPLEQEGVPNVVPMPALSEVLKKKK